MTVLGSTVKNN